MPLIFTFRDEPSAKRVRSPKLTSNVIIENPQNGHQEVQPENDEVFVTNDFKANESLESNRHQLSPRLKSDEEQTENEVSLNEPENSEPATNDQQSLERDIQRDEFVVTKDGEKINSWMCKTCNCLFLNEVSFKFNSIS